MLENMESDVLKSSVITSGEIISEKMSLREYKGLLTVFREHSDVCWPLSKPHLLDLSVTDVDLKGFTGGFTYDHYGYFVPYYD